MNETAKHHATEWKRAIISAGADENIAQQAIALAGLNGLFEPHREIELLRPDAARYQYLRSRPEDTIGKGGVFAGWTPKTGSGGMILTEEDLDRAVDEARALEQHVSEETK